MQERRDILVERIFTASSGALVAISLALAVLWLVWGDLRLEPVLVILGLLSKRTNRWGATAGILVGFTTAMAWRHVEPLFGGALVLGSGLAPGFALSFAATCLVSLATGGAEGERGRVA